MGYGNADNKWNGYSEVELCTYDTPVEAPEIEVEIETRETKPDTTDAKELPFPEGRKGFNIVNKWVGFDSQVNTLKSLACMMLEAAASNHRWFAQPPSRKCWKHQSEGWI